MIVQSIKFARLIIKTTIFIVGTFSLISCKTSFESAKATLPSSQNELEANVPVSPGSQPPIVPEEPLGPGEPVQPENPGENLVGSSYGVWGEVEAKNWLKA